MHPQSHPFVNVDYGIKGWPYSLRHFYTLKAQNIVSGKSIVYSTNSPSPQQCLPTALTNTKC